MQLCWVAKASEIAIHGGGLGSAWLGCENQLSGWSRHRAGLDWAARTSEAASHGIGLGWAARVPEIASRCTGLGWVPARSPVAAQGWAGLV